MSVLMERIDWGMPSLFRITVVLEWMSSVFPARVPVADLLHVRHPEGLPDTTRRTVRPHCDTKGVRISAFSISAADQP
jgi:hypothetical protein